MPADTPGSIDFGRSMLRFSTTRVNHTPRLLIDAACTLSSASGSRTFYLSCPCIAEAMYLPQNLIHDPVSEFVIIGAPGDQFCTHKRHGDGSRDLRAAHRVGEKMPTHDGKGATMTELAVTLRRHARVQPIRTYAEFRAALLDDQLINARTTFTDTDGVTVTLDYPARTVNVAHDKEAWQVDAGPILMPAAPTAAAALPVSCLDVAYLVYNRFDYGEATLRRSAAGGDARCQFELRRKLDCRHEMFVVE
jgi:hypothetical protein